jgi:1,4-dihydroxy-2-naphthoyl-CoA hydrolase
VADVPKLSDLADDQIVEHLNSWSAGWPVAMGIRFVRATAEEVVAEIEVGPSHLQPYGLVHGGVYSGLVETVTSVGAALDVMPRGQSAVGLENHTSFLQAVREGVIRAAARQIVGGRRTQVWEANVTDGGGRLVATGRVRFLVIDAGGAVAGETVRIKQ